MHFFMTFLFSIEFGILIPHSKHCFKSITYNLSCEAHQLVAHDFNTLFVQGVGQVLALRRDMRIRCDQKNFGRTSLFLNSAFRQQHKY
jgi:hypothetical protein